MTIRSAGAALLSCVVLGLSVLAHSPAQVQPSASAPLTEPALVQIEVSPRMMTALYHRATCPWLRASDSQLRQFEIVEAKKRYYQPHCECERSPEHTQTRRRPTSTVRHPLPGDDPEEPAMPTHAQPGRSYSAAACFVIARTL